MGPFIFTFPLNLLVMRLEETAPTIDIDASSFLYIQFLTIVVKTQ